jgi:hypothetical protein
MTRKRHIVPVDSTDARETGAQGASDEGVLALESQWADDDWAEDAPAAEAGRFGWAVPALALCAVLGWTAVFVWARLDAMLAGADATHWTDWATAWAVPVLLVATLWLLAMRTSRREAARFVDSTRALAEESTRLEERLTTVNRELSLAREFITSQSRDLETFGRLAVERLSTHAEQLQALVRDNGAQVDAISTVSTTALDNMERLRGNLPVIANSARDVTNQIGAAGLTAKNQLEDLVSGFHRLNEFGQASERQVQSLRAQIDAALFAFETQARRLDDIASGHFALLEQQSETFRHELDGQEAEALASIRQQAEALAMELQAGRQALVAQEAESLGALRDRMAALRDQGASLSSALRAGEDSALAIWQESITRLDTELGRALVRINTAEEAALASALDRVERAGSEVERLDQQLREQVSRFQRDLDERHGLIEARNAEDLAAIERRLAQFDGQFAQRREDQLALSRDLAAQGEALATRLDRLQQDMELIANQGDLVQSKLARGLAELAEKVAASRKAIQGTDGEVAALTDASVRLLELIQASAQHSRERLPAALEEAERRLMALRENGEALDLLFNQAGDKGQALSDYVISAGKDARHAMEDVDTFHERLAASNEAHGRSLSGLRVQLALISEEAESGAHHAQVELVSAITRLQDAAREAVRNLETESATAITQVASRIGDESARAIEHALQERGAQAIALLEETVAHASGKSRDAAIHLRDQLTKVDELARNLEARVAQARARAEEQVDNDFARRVALITESLNSHAIDIAKAMSNEVTDTAWASYLRGDRGIFTRRAVKLLDNTEARAIAEIYGDDQDFREHVSRYVHDFEAMLRTLLSTRDGHALSITLLSSDMGKLYVALAQAIERFRT